MTVMSKTKIFFQFGRHVAQCDSGGGVHNVGDAADVAGGSEGGASGPRGRESQPRLSEAITGLRDL